MISATSMVQKTPIFGRMFTVDTTTGLEEINSWPALMIMSSFIWLAVAGLLGVAMPLIQMLGLNTDWFYIAITGHGAALAFPFTFQLMVGVGLHRLGGCVGKPVTGVLPALIFIFMNVGSGLLTLAILMGFKTSLVLMYPLPVVGVQLGQWSMDVLVLAFTGIALVLVVMILLYPILTIKMSFFDKKREDLLLSERSMKDPGMLGMIFAALILLITGIPLLLVATPILLGLYGIIPMEMLTWATEPVVFQFVFFIFAHNLMEAMAMMIISAIYATLPLYLADGTRKLYSDKIANLALWILLLTSVTSFFHHFITLFPALPAALVYHGNIMSWATGIGAALSIFTILATIWQHGVKLEPGLSAIFIGFVLYILDGASAMVTSNIAWSFQLHGTMWQSGHTMTVLVAMSLMWMGVLYHHYPVITGRKLDEKLGNLYVKLCTVGCMGAALSMLAGGSAGMPRRFADWGQGGWMIYGGLILVFGLVLGLSYLVFAINLYKSQEISSSTPEYDGAVAQDV